MADLKTAFYRKYRPKKFADIIGQDDISLALKNQLIRGKVGHAYIFTGIHGTGKTSIARLLAKAVNCPQTKDGEPCGVCDICTGIDAGSLLDVTEIDAASNSGVDNVRMLREETAYYPTVCKMRVYIIDEAHMLTREAFNALLKIMEEPPGHILFILATTEIHKVPATILSRCQRFELHRLQSADIQKNILDIACAEKIEITEEAAALIARLSNGAMRDAQSLLDTCASLGGQIDEQTVARLAGVSDKQYLFDLCDEISAKDISAVFARLHLLYTGSMDPTRLCLELIQHYRNLLLFRMNDPNISRSCSAGEAARYREQSAGFELRQIIACLSMLSQTAERMSDSPERMLVLELGMLRLCGQDITGTDSAPRKQPAETARLPKQKPEPPKPQVAPRKEGAVPKKPVPQEAPPAPQSAEKAANTAPRREAAGMKPLENWKSVVDALLPKNGMLYGYLSNSAAYLTDSHILIDADETFMAYIRKNSEAKDLIKEALATIADIRLPIGPYTKSTPEDPAVRDAQDEDIDQLIARAQESGIEVEIIN